MKSLNYSLQIFLLSAFVGSAVFAQTLTSGNQQIQLIELYTSEGCSSCPPADRWLGQLQYDKDLWSVFVPVAFHVDYWDYLGWQDKFAEQAFSDRQHSHYTQGNISRVYTPGFVIQGQEWRGWFQRESRPARPVQNIGILKLNVENSTATIDFTPQITMTDGIVNFAVLGFGLKHSIFGGENAGTELNHDFVVLDHQHKPAQFKNKTLSAEFMWTPSASRNSTKLAIAAWITPIDQLKPVQAIGGWYETHN